MDDIYLMTDNGRAWMELIWLYEKYQGSFVVCAIS